MFLVFLAIAAAVSLAAYFFSSKEEQADFDNAVSARESPTIRYWLYVLVVSCRVVSLSVDLI